MKKLIAKLSSIRLSREQAYAAIPLMFLGSVLIIFLVNLLISFLLGR